LWPGQGTARRRPTHRHPAHRLHTAGQHQVIPTGRTFCAAGVDGLQPDAQTVELHAAVVSGMPRPAPRTRDVPALITERRNHAEDHVVISS